MSTRNISLFILGLLVALQASWANAASIVDLPFLDRQFSIDGKVTSDEINGAAVIDLTAMGELAKPRYLTKIYSIVTPNALYFGFVCDDPTPKDLVAKEKKTNGPVFADDSIEFFFTPNMEGNKYNYFHFAVNAAGVTYSASMEDDAPALNWECAVKPTEKGWGGGDAHPAGHRAGLAAHVVLARQHRAQPCGAGYGTGGEKCLGGPRNHDAQLPQVRLPETAERPATGLCDLGARTRRLRVGNDRHSRAGEG